MIWANLGVLALGAGLLLLPIVLHLLMQPKPKVLPFPALQFVRERHVTNQSRMRLRHLLLLLLRCLLILCLAAALAGPAVASRQFGQWVTLGGVGISALIVLFALLTVWFGRRDRSTLVVAVLSLLLLGHLVFGAWSAFRLLTSDAPRLIGDSAAPVSALVLVDNSCRMDYRRENQSNVSRAKEMADWMVKQFPLDSQVCVLATDTEMPFFSVDPGAARNRLENLEIEYLNLPIPDRVAAGMELLEDAIHERKEIYVLSDLSRRSWDSATQSLASQLERSPEISLFVIDVGQQEANNFALAPLQLEYESIAQSGEIEIATGVNRVGDAAQRNVRFRLERPDNTRPVVRDRQVLLPDQFTERVKTLDIRKDSTAPISFKFSEKLPLGIHHGKVEIIGTDSLAVDDIRYFTVEVVQSWKVLVIHPSNVVPDNLTEAIQDETENSLYECTVVSQQSMPNSLDAYDAVFLLDPEPGLSETTWATLREYVAAGHGLGIFLGANAADGGYGASSFTTAEAQQVLGGKLSRQWRRPDADLFLSPDNLAHPIFAPFRSWESSVPWNQFPVFIHWSIEPDSRWEEFPTRTVLRFGNGKPAILERQIGEGRVIIMTTPITEAEQMEGRSSWNSLFSGFPLPAWLLVRQISQYLVRSQTDQLNLLVGELARLRNDYRRYPESYRIFTPRTNHTPEKVTATDGFVKYRFNNSPGQYRLKGNRDGPIQRGFSVNLAAGETDLTRIEPAELDQILGANRYQLATQRDQIQRQQGTTRRGQEFYPLLLLMLLVILGVEYLLSNRFYS